MSSCPHGSMPCDAKSPLLRAACPGIDEEELFDLAQTYPVEASKNPLLSLFLLEHPAVWGKTVAEINVAVAIARQEYLYDLTLTELRLFALDAVEHVWWIRKKLSNEHGEHLIASIRNIHQNPYSQKEVSELSSARYKVRCQVQGATNSTGAREVLRALYLVSGTRGHEYRKAIGLCIHAVYLRQERKDFAAASRNALAEAEWQRSHLDILRQRKGAPHV